MDIHHDQPILITAQKWERSYSASTSSVSLYRESDFIRSGAQSVSEFLKGRAGINLYTSGSFGKASTLSLRGTSNRHTLVIIDGVRITDITAIGGGGRLEFISLDNIESIEVLKGSQGVVYGAEAIGGVIKIKTKRDDQKSIKGSYGSYKNKKLALNIGHHYNEKIHFHVTGSYQDVEGISAHAKRAGGRDPDGLKNINVNSFVSYEGNQRRVAFSGAYQRSEFGFDDFLADADNEGKYQNHWINIALIEKSLKSFTPEVEVDYRKVARKVIQRGTMPATYLYDGETFHAEVRTPFYFERGSFHFEILPGLDYENERANNLGISTENTHQRHQNSLFLNTRVRYQRVFFEVGGRHESYSVGGEKSLYRTALGINITPKVTLKASQATGFKVASLYQSFSQYGNIDLSPENSFSREVGLYAHYNSFSLDISLFDLKYDNYIDYDLSTKSYQNLGGLENRGFEIAVEKNIQDYFLKGEYNYLLSRDPQTNELAVRRAKKRASFSVSKQLFKALDVTMSALYVGERLESERSRMPSYTLFNLMGSYHWKKTTFSIGVNNLLNHDYEEQRFFETPGRNIIVTLKQVL